VIGALEYKKFKISACLNQDMIAKLLPMLFRFSTLETPWGLRQYRKNLEFKEKLDEGKQKYTKGGDFVQSEGERKIHDFLTNNNVIFEYDQRIVLRVKGKFGFFKDQWVRPDFHLNQQNAVIEYWGFINHGDYNKKMNQKRRWYQEAGLILIDVYPSDLNNLDQVIKPKLKQVGAIK
jgi:hypothetical protein